MSTEKKTEKDQIKPSHYRDGVFPEVIEMMKDLFTKEEVLAFCKLNSFKYRMRAGLKSDNIEVDIKKAIFYENYYKTLIGHNVPASDENTVSSSGLLLGNDNVTKTFPNSTKVSILHD